MRTIMLVCFVMVSGLAGMGSAAVLSDSFEDGNYTANPTWYPHTTWAVVQEPFLFTGVEDNQYLHLGAASTDGKIYATGGPKITDGKFELTMRIKPENTALTSDNYQIVYIGEYSSVWSVSRLYPNSYFFQVINRANSGVEVKIQKWRPGGTDRPTLASTNAYPFDGNWVDVKFTYEKSSPTSGNLKLYIGDMQTPYLTATDDGTTYGPLFTNFDSVALQTKLGGYSWALDDLTVVPDGSKLAQNPNPTDHAFVVAPSVSSLSWINPDPNGPSDSIICDVYFGKSITDPNLYDKVTLGSDVSTVAINTTNFPKYGNLAVGNYYWRVDCKDTGTGVTTEGYEWAFYVVNPCELSHRITGDPYDDGDINVDCKVNLWDFAVVAEDWLKCTDTISNCGN